MKKIEILEKKEKYWKNISYILAIFFLIFTAYYYFSNIGNYIEYYGGDYLLYLCSYNLENIIINFSLEIGILLYFFKIITKKAKDIKSGSIYLVLGGFIAIITPLLHSIFSLINGTVLLSVHLTNLAHIILNFGIIQYFLSIKRINNSKTITLISCLLVALCNVYYCFTDFHLINLLLVLLYLSLIPYFYTMELKDSEKIKLSLKELEDKKSLKICVSVLVGIYFILGIINSSGLLSGTVYSFLLFSSYILIFTWFNKTNISVFITSLELASIISYVISYGASINYILLIISLIAIIIVLLKKPSFNKVIENDNKIKEDIEENIEEDELKNKNKKYKDLLDMGIISQEEYDNITKE